MAYVWFTVPTELAETLQAIVDEYTMLKDIHDSEGEQAKLIRRLNRALEPD